VQALKRAAEKLKIRLIFLAPTSAYLQNRMFGLTPAKAVSIEDLHEMLDWDGCYGLDETPFSSVIDKDEGMLGLFEATLAKGKVVTGHVRGANERQVQAFVGMGGSVDHESVSVDDVLARARAGMKVLMRFGSGVPDLPNLIGAYTKVGISPRQLALCTDVLLPEAIFEGGVDIAVRKTIEAGIDPVEAIGMGSLNVAEAFRADHDIGSVTPGRFADMALLEELATFKIRKVIFGGEEVVDRGRLLIDNQRPTYMPFARISRSSALTAPTWLSRPKSCSACAVAKSWCATERSWLRSGCPSSDYFRINPTKRCWNVDAKSRQRLNRSDARSMIRC
jgi:adenine deaminase